MAKIRVLESFRAPHARTNPYISRLAHQLTADEQLSIRYFSWREALRGDYDVFHVHWPDALLDGDTALKRAGKRLALLALAVRLTVTRTPIVRTMHNAAPHEPTFWARVSERLISRRTKIRILLNDVGPAAGTDIVIKHGDYRTWFEEFPKAGPRPKHLSFVGLIRPYKGVEDLIRAFGELEHADPAARLEIAGRPRTDDLRTELEALARPIEGCTLRLEFVDDATLVNIVTSSQIVVLPYRGLTNSGAALAALSLDRPVLLPRTPGSESLQLEVGERWVHLFEGTITAAVLSQALDDTANLAADETVTFENRSWNDVGERHRAAFSRALKASAPPRRHR